MWCTNFSYRSSDGDVCCVDAQMINDMQCTSEGVLYTSQVVNAYLRFLPQLQPAADWLVCQAEAVCIKTVYLGNCAICDHHIGTGLGKSNLQTLIQVGRRAVWYIMHGKYAIEQQNALLNRWVNSSTWHPITPQNHQVKWLPQIQSTMSLGEKEPGGEDPCLPYTESGGIRWISAMFSKCKPNHIDGMIGGLQGECHEASIEHFTDVGHRPSPGDTYDCNGYTPKGWSGANPNSWAPITATWEPGGRQQTPQQTATYNITILLIFWKRSSPKRTHGKLAQDYEGIWDWYYCCCNTVARPTPPLIVSLKISGCGRTTSWLYTASTPMKGWTLVTLIAVVKQKIQQPQME